MYGRGKYKAPTSEPVYSARRLYLALGYPENFEQPRGRPVVLGVFNGRNCGGRGRTEEIIEREEIILEVLEESDRWLNPDEIFEQLGDDTTNPKAVNHTLGQMVERGLLRKAYATVRGKIRIFYMSIHRETLPPPEDEVTPRPKATLKDVVLEVMEIGKPMTADALTVLTGYNRSSVAAVLRTLVAQERLKKTTVGWTELRNPLFTYTRIH